MKSHPVNKKFVIIALILGIAAVFFYQYQVFVARSDSIKREHAQKTVEEAYKLTKNYLDRNYSGGDDYSGLNVASDLDGVLVSMVSKKAETKGQMLDVPGALFAKPSSGAAAMSITDYLNAFTFTDSEPFSAVESAINTGIEALSRCYDPVAGISYYVYFKKTEFKNFDIVLLYESNRVDDGIASISYLAGGFFFAELTLFVLLVTWVIFEQIYAMIANKRNTEHIEMVQRRYKTALTNKNNFIWEYFLESDTMVWDDANSVREPIFDVSGKHRKEMISSGKIYIEDQWPFYQFCDDLVTDEPDVSAEIRVKNPDGEYCWYRFSGTKVFNEDHYPTSVIGQALDINKDKLETEKLREAASRDTLTKLYSYAKFEELVEASIANNEDAEIMALMLIDIDDFSMINSNFGYAFADALLVDIAARLRKIFPSGTILGRFGGDEFIAFVHNIPSMSYVVELCQSVLESAQNVITQKHSISCSIGVSLFPVDDMTYPQLFNKADMALYDAKEKGKGRYSIYHTGMKQIPEATRNKNNIKLKLPSVSTQEHQSVDSTILSNAIDILFDSRDLSLSIGLMLSIIGIYYKLDHLEIIEFREYKEGTRSKLLHEWVSENSDRLPGSVASTEYDKSTLFLGYEGESSDAFMCDDIHNMCSVGVDIMKDPYLSEERALLQFGIRYQNDYIYVINAAVKEPHEWSRDEVDSLTILAKLIGSYLVQLRSQETLDFVSQMDSLTGSYNFTAFLQRADELLKAASGKQYAFIYADIQQFKLINDTYGYTVGDSILLCLSEILRRVGGVNSLLSRITGDRFVAMYPYESGTELQNKLGRIINDSKHIAQSNGEYYRFVLTLGVYLAETGDSAILAVDRANIANQNITDYLNTSFMFYDESMHENLLEQKDIEDSMEEALKNKEFLVFYQPKVNLETGVTIGSEALVRWKRGDRIIPPDKFIPVFEENGFILNLDYYMLDRVCATMRKCLDEGLEVKPVSVNFSRLHLNNTALPAQIESTLRKYSVSPSLIEVEITESALNAQNTYQLRILNDIRAIGCHLAMDDFGSGMSSLNVLRELPFDILKLDKDFLHNNVMTSREQVIIKSIIQLAKELKMQVICEGIETEEQSRFLKSIGCTNGQGYLFSKPVPEEEFLNTYYRK
jgi:diguanylate cyclase (GGDEF)-like protein